MTTLNYTIRAVSRLSPGAGPEVLNTRMVHEVIPGGTIRGAVASAWVGQHNFDWKSPMVASIFQSALWFSQAIPEGSILRGLSEVSCKYEESGKACTDAAHDIAHRIASGQQPEPRCPSCRGGWDRKYGWEWPGKRIVARTRTALVNGVAKSEALFTRSALERGTVLEGTIRIEDSLDQGTLDWLQSEQHVRVGGQRSVLGHAIWSAAISVETPPPPGPQPARVVVRCASPLIIPGTHGGPSLDIQAALQGVLGDQISVVAAWVRPVRVSGWHMASGLPKPEEWACAAGSTAVIEGAPDDLVQRLVEGVGLRRREGFGQLFVVDEPTPAMAEQVEEPREPTAEEFARLADHINLGPRSQVQDGESAADDAAEPHADRDWDEQPTEPEPSHERERKVDDVLAAVAVQPNTSQRSIVNGLVNAITRMRRIREAGSPEANARLALSDFLGRPSMRALPAAVVQLIKELLSDPDTANLAELRDAVERQAKLRGML